MKAKQLTQFNGRVIRMVLASSLALGTGFSGTNSYAGSATSSMTVSATVAANCLISAGALGFGTYDPVAANASTSLDGTATLTVTCTSGSAAKIRLGQGANADTGGGSTDATPVRRMLSGGNYLSYQLYQDVGHSTIWGNTDGTHVNYTGTGSSGSVTVYGRVNSGQNKPAGSYSDTVLATIDF
jgi:spore coat protein U-like protein